MNLFTDEVLMHFTESSVSTSVNRPAVDVVAVQLRLKNENADVGNRAEIDELLDLMLKESFIDQRHKHELSSRCSHHDTTLQSIIISQHLSTMFKLA